MRDDKKELPIKDQVIVDTLLLQHYNIAAAYISERYGIPEEQIEPKRTLGNYDNAPPTPPSSPKNKAPLQPGSGAHQQGCTCQSCTGNYLNTPFDQSIMMSAVPGEEELEAAVEQLYKALWDGEMEGVSIPADVALARSKSIWNGFVSKLSKQLKNPAIESPDNLRIALFEANVNIYSAAATLSEWQQLNQAAAESETYTDFERKAKNLLGKTSIYLRTEYDTAMATSQNASAWVRQQAEKDDFDLMFDAIVDGGTTEGCLNLNGLVRSATDPIWSIIYPPNHWRCRSEVLQVPKGSQAYTDNEPDISWIKPGFNINRGDANVVFAEGQGYFEKEFSATKLKAKSYGLPPELPKNELQANLPEESQKNYEEWWAKNQQANGLVYLKNHLNLAIELPKILRTKFAKEKYSGQNRQGIATKLLSEIFTKPDEVWINKNTAKGAPSSLRHVYLKRYGNDTFAAITDNQKALTWYKVDYPDALFQVRKGILTHKKNAGKESGT
jgi:SPP1 gp7 family putative phage head morphogenesis protein